MIISGGNEQVSRYMRSTATPPWSCGPGQTERKNSRAGTLTGRLFGISSRVGCELASRTQAPETPICKTAGSSVADAEQPNGNVARRGLYTPN